MRIICKMAANFNQKDLAITLGERLREARLARHMTMVELASLTNIHQGQISRFENGQFQSPSTNLQYLCKFFEIDWEHPTVVQDVMGMAKRVADAAALSPRWRQALTALLEAIEEQPVGDALGRHGFK